MLGLTAGVAGVPRVALAGRPTPVVLADRLGDELGRPRAAPGSSATT